MEEIQEADAQPSAEQCTIVSQESEAAHEIESNHDKTFEHIRPLERIEVLNGNKGVIDTATPIDSVKSAVSKYGGIVDWKAHKATTLEKYTHIQRELEKVQQDIPKYKKQSETAQTAKDQVLEELDATKKLVEELKDSFEKTRTEEAQAKQDSELAQLRVKEIEQGISNDASHAAKAQLEVAKARHESAILELKSVKEELTYLQENYNKIVSEKNLAVAKSQEAVLVSKDTEKKADDLTIELITIKEALELAHSSHLEAEERRIAKAMARDQELLALQNEVNQAKDELKKLEDHKSSFDNLKSDFEAKSSMLSALKNKITSITNTTSLPVDSEQLDKAKKDLEDVNISIEKAKEEAKCLRVAASSLKADLDRGSEALAALRQNQNQKSTTIPRLQSEITLMQSELELAQIKEREAKDKIEDLTKLLEQGTQEADQTKSIAHLAPEELKEAEEELENTKANRSTVNIRLIATRKEIEASKKSKALAIQAVKAMQESESHSDGGVTLNLEEYYVLSKKALEAEELANERVISAIAKLKEAKSSENSKLAKLEEACKELEEKREALKKTMILAEKANAGKLATEQELRDWRSENELKRRASDSHASHLEMNNSENSDNEINRQLNEEASSSLSINTMSCPDLYGDQGTPEVKPIRKKSFFPRVVMFLARKKAQSLK